MLRARRECRYALCGLVAALALAVGPPASAVSAAGVAAGAVDVAVVRPLNIAALAAGAIFFVATVPLVAPFEGIKTAWTTFVYAPYEYTFRRPIGDF